MLSSTLAIPNSLSLTGRVAIVTGAGSPGGIGFFSAKALLALGASVIITSTTDRIQTRVQELIEAIPGCSVVGIVAEDLADEMMCRRVVQTALDSFGGDQNSSSSSSSSSIHILVNNAGMTSVSQETGDVSIGNAESGDAMTISLEVLY